MNWIEYGVDILNKSALDKKYNLVAIALDRKDRILSIGFNSYTKTHPKQKLFSSIAKIPHKEFLHAEIDALIRAKDEVYRLVIVRMNRSRNVLSAKPCPVCDQAIKQYGVKVVEYSV